MTKGDEEQDIEKLKDTPDDDIGYLLQKARSFEEISNLDPNSHLKYLQKTNNKSLVQDHEEGTWTAVLRSGARRSSC